jgi:hydroxymethylpyrimidine/phosphomethylpyrimidine kinase
MDSGDTAGVMQRLPIALTIAGSDSGGGAGIQADLKTFAALGVYAASVVTALTAQNTRGVRAIHFPPPGIVGAQIEAVLEDFAVAAIKIGMLGSAEIANVVAERLPAPSPQPSPKRRGGETLLPLGEVGPKGRMRAFVVYDPVMTASSGDLLSGSGFVEAVRHALLPLVDCLTPNLAEAAALLSEPIAKSEADMRRQGGALLKLGPRAILMKGGHLEGDEAVDLLVTENAVRRFAAPRLASQNLHGTGCTLSSAIAANIVLGTPLPEAVAAAKTFVRRSIERGQYVTLGAGAGPLIQTELRSKL